MVGPCGRAGWSFGVLGSAFAAFTTSAELFQEITIFDNRGHLDFHSFVVTVLFHEAAFAPLATFATVLGARGRRRLLASGSSLRVLGSAFAALSALGMLSALLHEVTVADNCLHLNAHGFLVSCLTHAVGFSATSWHM